MEKIKMKPGDTDQEIRAKHRNNIWNKSVEAYLDSEIKYNDPLSDEVITSTVRELQKLHSDDTLILIGLYSGGME